MGFLSWQGDGVRVWIDWLIRNDADMKVVEGESINPRPLSPCERERGPIPLPYSIR